MNEYDSLLLRFDYRAAWNAIGPNAEISSEEVAMFVCPSRRTGGKAESDFFFPVGPDFAFQEGVNSTQRNIFGLSGTIVMYEASNQGIRWAEPRDPLLNSKSPRLPPSHHEGSTNVVLGDGSIRSISADIDPEVLSKLLRPTMDR